MMSSSSIKIKLISALILIAIATLLVSTITAAKGERKLAENLVEDSLWHSADSYFDSINTLMLTGQMSTRSILQEKILQQGNIIEARIIRSPITSALYGKGHDDQAPIDELDNRALLGEPIFQLTKVNDQRQMTVIQPLIASSDFRGTDCLACHAAAEGDVLGAVRITSSLKTIDAQITSSIFQSAVLQFVTLLVAFVLLGIFLRRLILVRLFGLQNKLALLEEDMDLTISFKTNQQDEIGDLSNGLNRMIARFRDNMIAVSNSTRSLLTVSQQVKEVATLTEAAVSDQKLETDSVATAVVELEATSREVKLLTDQAATLSQDAAKTAQQGGDQALDVATSINVLSEAIQQTSSVIYELDSQTQSVSKVVDVIAAIAEQTNLLALNAAIEAARAGEQGRGFAVVADEVRSLANRTHESTEDIKTTINVLLNETKTAVTVMAESTEHAQARATDVQNVADMLNAISLQVDQINELNTQIASSFEQQNQTTAEINQNVNKIIEISDQTESVAEKSKHNSAELVSMAEELEERVKRFKL